MHNDRRIKNSPMSSLLKISGCRVGLLINFNRLLSKLNSRACACARPFPEKYFETNFIFSYCASSSLKEATCKNTRIDLFRNPICSLKSLFFRWFLLHLFSNPFGSPLYCLRMASRGFIATPSRDKTIFNLRYLDRLCRTGFLIKGSYGK